MRSSLVGILTGVGVPDVADVVTSVPTLVASQTVVGVSVVAVVAAVSGVFAVTVVYITCKGCMDGVGLRSIMEQETGEQKFGGSCHSLNFIFFRGFTHLLITIIHLHSPKLFSIS